MAITAAMWLGTGGSVKWHRSSRLIADLAISPTAVAGMHCLMHLRCRCSGMNSGK